MIPKYTFLFIFFVKLTTHVANTLYDGCLIVRIIPKSIKCPILWLIFVHVARLMTQLTGVQLAVYLSWKALPIIMHG